MNPNRVAFFCLALLCLCHSLSAQSAKWTVLVYMNADNDLERFGIKDFLEMSRINNSKEVNVLVQMDRSPKYSEDYGNWTQTLRFKIEHNGTPTKKESLMDLGETNMGNPSVLKDFIEWGKKSYPAQNYILILWDHGDGWRYSEANVLNARLQKLYLEDYAASLAANEKIRFQNQQNHIAQLRSYMAELQTVQHTLVTDLNLTSQKFSVLPDQLKEKVGVQSDFNKLYSLFKSYISSSIEKIPNDQVRLITDYSNTLDKLIFANVQIENLSNTIESAASKDTTRITPSANDIKMGTISTDPVKAVSHDDTDKDMLFNKEIQDCVSDNQFQIIGFDACLMSMIETGYALRKKANYLIGSEELEPGNGWNYSLWLSDLVANPSMTPLELSKDIVENYAKTYQYQFEVTLSAIDLTLIDRLCQLINQLSNTLINSMSSESSRITASRNNCQKYAIDYAAIHSIDLSLFLYHLGGQTTNNIIKGLVDQIRSMINLMVVANFYSDDRNFQPSGVSYGSFGLAIYFPKRKEYFDDAYTEANNDFPVEFVRKISWDNFLESYFNHLH